MFDRPIEEIVAFELDEVPAALERVERQAMRGNHAVGFVSYDAAPAFDSALAVPGRSALPLIWFGIYENADHAALEHAAPSAAFHLPRTWNAHVSRDAYDGEIASIHSAIEAGDVYQVNHTLRFHADWSGDPLAAYESLRSAQGDAYAAYIDTGRFRILSASPELFFKREGRRIISRPMKGTCRRGRWEEEDQAAAASLRASEKERAENVMIVDLVRNDLGRIATTGSVSVPELFSVQRYPTVWQMTSTVAAELRDDVGLVDIFRAIFPCGSVVGAPKIAAARRIADHEGAPRGVYCGAIGVVRPGGDCTFNVAIRTLVVDVDSGVAEYGAGGGVTIDSSASGEFDELHAKAAILGGVPQGFELIETMRLDEGQLIRRSRHLARLASSAGYFGFPILPAELDQMLDSLVSTKPLGRHRVRLLLNQDGVARLECSSIDGDLAAPLAFAVARSPVPSHDPFLFHKTTRRAIYEGHRRDNPGAAEVILWNERDEITECTIGNLVYERDGARWTPPRECGLLGGVYRAELLDRGEIKERILRRDELRLVDALWLVNSLREWVPLYPVGSAHVRHV